MLNKLAILTTTAIIATSTSSFAGDEGNVSDDPKDPRFDKTSATYDVDVDIDADAHAHKLRERNNAEANNTSLRGNVATKGGDPRFDIVPGRYDVDVDVDAEADVQKISRH